jgi:hypothetical protein
MFLRPSRRFKTLAAALLLAPLAISAQPPAIKPAKPATPAAIDTSVKVEDLQKTQEDIKKNFTQFKEGLFRLATRLEKSERQEAKDQAKSIKKALEEADKLGVDQQFAKLVTSLRNGNDALDLTRASQEEKELVKSLQAILLLLETDNETLRLKEEREKLEAFLKELQNIKERQQNNQARTESKTGNKDNLSKEQQKLKDETDDVGKRMANKDGKEGAGGKPKDDRAEAKAEPKAGEKGGEEKPESGQSKSEQKDGNAKEAGEGKPGESKPGDPKKGEGKEGAGGDPKKSDPKDGGDGKPGEPKPGEPKPGEGKPGEGKPGEPKPGEGKGEGAGKGEAKPSEGKGGEAKGSGEGKPGQSQPGGGQSGSKGGEQPPPPGSPPQPQQPKGNELPGRKEVQEAVPHQQKAEDQIKGDKRDDAGKNQDKAIEKLAEAIKEIEKRIKQLREEEMKKLLANVEARCQRMLAMQIDVYQKTKGIDDEVQKNGGQLGQAERQKALGQSEAEGQIIVEAEKCLKLLESEGSAVAFAKVLEEVREDMIAVQRRLNTAIVDKDTQTIEENIIAMLKDMLEALKKAQKELGEQKPSQSKPGQKPPNAKLIDMLAELKLIRSLQVQVNNRTKMYGDKDKSEQSKDDLVQKELRQLSIRQAKLQEMVDKLDKGENEK